MALSAQFSDASNPAASRATIAFIFLYSCGYALFFNSTIYLVSSEILPVFLRSKGMGLATFCNGVTSIVLAQITPAALDNISWRFYAVFIAASVVGAVMYSFVFPETKNLTLEGIGTLFGDEMATTDMDNIRIHSKVAETTNKQ